MLGLTELVSRTTSTEGNRAIFGAPLVAIPTHGARQKVEVTVGGYIEGCLAGHFRVSAGVQEHELSNFAGLGLKEQEEERLSSSGGGVEGVSRMTKSAIQCVCRNSLPRRTAEAQVAQRHEGTQSRAEQVGRPYRHQQA